MNPHTHKLDWVVNEISADAVNLPITTDTMVLFSDSGNISYDSNFIWDDKKLGIGTAPSYPLEIQVPAATLYGLYLDRGTNDVTNAAVPSGLFINYDSAGSPSASYGLNLDMDISATTGTHYGLFFAVNSSATKTGTTFPSFAGIYGSSVDSGDWTYNGGAIAYPTTYGIRVAGQASGGDLIASSGSMIASYYGAWCAGQASSLGTVTGTVSIDTYGGYFQALGQTGKGTSTSYGVYTKGTGSDTNYDLYLDGVYNIAAGGTMSILGGSATADDLNLWANNNAFDFDNSGRINLYERVEFNESAILNGANETLAPIQLAPTVTMSNTLLGLTVYLYGRGTITATTNPVLGNWVQLFMAQPLIKTETATIAVPNLYSFYSLAISESDGVASGTTTINPFRSANRARAVNSGTNNVGNFHSFRSAELVGDSAVGDTTGTVNVTDLVGFKMVTPNLGRGTEVITTLSGVWIDDLVGTGSTDIYGVVVDSDTEGLTLGAGQDAEIYYDGTDLIVDTKTVGSGTLKTTGGKIVKTHRITSAVTLDATYNVVFADSDGGAFVVGLPAGVEGTHYKISNVGTSANDITIEADGAELVFGELKQDISDGEVLNIHYNTTEGWF